MGGGSGFRVFGFRVQGLGVRDLGFRILGVSGLAHRPSMMQLEQGFRHSLS